MSYREIDVTVQMRSVVIVITITTNVIITIIKYRKKVGKVSFQFLTSWYFISS